MKINKYKFIICMFEKNKNTITIENNFKVNWMDSI